MPRYDFECGSGHVTELVYLMNDPQRPARVRCSICRKVAKRIFSKPAVVDDFPEHFNVSMGCVVKNRAHHKQIQQERGLKDWEPLKEGPMTSTLRKQGLI